jgi:DNA-binding NarL/FixJ family response regulator
VIAVLSAETLARQGIAELLRKAGYTVVECAVPAQLRSYELGAVVVDLDHIERDTRALVRETRAAAGEGLLVAIGSPLRLGAAIECDHDIALADPDIAELVAAIRSRRRERGRALADQRRTWGQLTPRQRDVLRHLATGLDNRAIAKQLSVGERAVKLHVSTLLELFGVANRTELALLAARAGLRP